MLLDRVQVPEGQTLGPMGASANPIDIAVAGFNPDNVLAQTADVLLDLPRCALSNRHTTEKGAHTNAEAQGRERAAQQMARECAQGDVQDDGEACPWGGRVVAGTTRLPFSPDAGYCVPHHPQDHQPGPRGSAAAASQGTARACAPSLRASPAQRWYRGRPARASWRRASGHRPRRTPAPL